MPFVFYSTTGDITWKADKTSIKTTTYKSAAHGNPNV